MKHDDLPFLIRQPAHALGQDDSVDGGKLFVGLQVVLPVLQGEFLGPAGLAQAHQAEVPGDGHDPCHGLSCGLVGPGGGMDAQIAFLEHVLRVVCVFQNGNAKGVYRALGSVVQFRQGVQIIGGDGGNPSVQLLRSVRRGVMAWKFDVCHRSVHPFHYNSARMARFIASVLKKFSFLEKCDFIIQYSAACCNKQSSPGVPGEDCMRLLVKERFQLGSQFIGNLHISGIYGLFERNQPMG